MLRLLLLLPLLVALGPPRLPAAEPPPVQSGRLVQSELADWLQGTLAGVYVEGGDLRLQPEQVTGSYVSPPVQAPFGINGAVLQWHAAATTAQTLTLELRSSLDGQSWTGWQRAVPSTASDGGLLSQLFVLHPSTSWIQYRALFEASAGSPALADVTLTYLSSLAGPALVDIAARRPPTGPPTLTPPPLTVSAADWGAVSSRREVERQHPRRVQITQVPAPTGDPNSAATVRALQWVALNLLQQDALPYHFVVDGAGTIYQGAGSATVRLSDPSVGTVEIALLADVQGEGLSDAARASLAGLLGWLSDAYGVKRAAVDISTDAPPQLRDRLPDLRAAMDRAIVRSRIFFTSSNIATGPNRLSLLNRGTDEARATLTTLSARGPERRSIAIPAGQRFDPFLSAALPLSDSAGLEILADRPLYAERMEIVGHELLGASAVTRPARAWYFAEGSSVDGDTTALNILNPQEREVLATVTLVPDAGVAVSQTLTLAARSRQTVALDQLLPGQHFSFKLIAAEPVVAERTVVAANGAAHLAPGVADLSRRWLFAEGNTMAGYTTTLALMNPWPQPVAITLHVSSEDGTSLDRRYAIPGQKRTVLTLNTIVPDLPFAMELQSDRPLAAERVMRVDNGRGATAGPGIARPATQWTFVEGSTATPAEEYLLIANPNPQQAVNLDIAYILADGRIERRTRGVGAASRLSILVNADVPNQPVVSAVVTADRPVVAERTMYMNGPNGRGVETSLGIPGD